MDHKRRASRDKAAFSSSNGHPYQPSSFTRPNTEIRLGALTPQKPQDDQTPNNQESQFAIPYVYVSDNEHSVQYSRRLTGSLSRREIWRLRIKNLMNGAVTSFPQSWRNRLPKGRAVWLILFINLLERAAYFGTVANVIAPFLAITGLSPALQAFIQAVCMNVFADLFYPITGWLADAWLGRYRAIHISLWILLVGYSSMTLLFSINVFDQPRHDSCHLYLLPLVFPIISIGTASLQANIIPYGADQLAATNAKAEQLSSYFYWYYGLRNVGALTFIFAVTCSDPIQDTQIRIVIFGGIASVLIAIGLVLWILLRHWLFIDGERCNPWKTIVKVVHFVVTVKRPRERSAFSYSGQATPSKFDLAKKVEGGPFESEEVENVRCFFRLLLALVTIGGFFMVYTGVTGVMTLQIRHMYNNFLYIKFNVPLNCNDPTIPHWIVNVLTIITVIPLLDQVVIPILREYSPSLLKRIGLGYIATVMTPILLLVFEHVGHHNAALPANVTAQCMFVDSDVGTLQLSSYVILLPYVLLSLGEVFVNISGLEFFYAQSPCNMRGMMIGLFFFTQGLFGTIAAFLLFIFSYKDRGLNIHDSKESCGFWYYLVFLAVVVLALALFCIISRRYKNRHRGELEEMMPFYRR